MCERIRFTLRLVAGLNTLLEQEATSKGMTKHALLVQILWEYVEKKR